MQSARVLELWRYPVKSMAGEALATAQVAPGTGIAGDRAFAVIDVELGSVASAKHPRKWNKLLDCTATLVDGRPHIALPDGTRLDPSRDDVDQRLSTAFGRQVRVSSTTPAKASYEYHSTANDSISDEPIAAAADAGTFFDCSPIHFVTTATLTRLQELLPGSRVDRARFRPNFVLDTGDAAGFVENAWKGKRLAIGDDLVLDVVLTCPRCVMTTLAQGELPADPAILRAAAEHNKQHFELSNKAYATVGMYANVVRGGVIRAGDGVRLI